MRRGCIAFLGCIIAAAPVLAADIKRASIDPVEKVKISPGLYGVNNSWNEITRDEFPIWLSTLDSTIGFIRYPGGWESEHFDWTTNSTPNWKKTPDKPGTSPDNAIKAVAASFVLPTNQVVTGKMSIDELAGIYRYVASRYGDAVKRWEIGNEWWMQAGAKKNDRKLKHVMEVYAHIVRVMAPLIKQVDPDSIVYVTVDWNRLEQLSELREAIGPEWRFVDGVSIHPYCGAETGAPQCSNIEEAAEEIRALSGKPHIYASEWAVVRQFTGDETGLAAANFGVLAIQEMAFGGIDSAAYWPAARAIPSLSMVTPDLKSLTAIGEVLGTLKENYEGFALRSEGDIPVAAALDSHGALSLIVPSMTPNPVEISIAIPPHWKNVQTAERTSAVGPMKQNLAKHSALQVSMANNLLSFSLNKDAPGWEIATIRLLP